MGTWELECQRTDSLRHPMVTSTLSEINLAVERIELELKVARLSDKKVPVTERASIVSKSRRGRR